MLVMNQMCATFNPAPEGQTNGRAWFCISQTPFCEIHNGFSLRVYFCIKNVYYYYYHYHYLYYAKSNQEGKFWCTDFRRADWHSKLDAGRPNWSATCSTGLFKTGCSRVAVPAEFSTPAGFCSSWLVTHSIPQGLAAESHCVKWVFVLASVLCCVGWALLGPHVGSPGH